MQFVNNDMDELMRRAADQLPLKPAGADWDAVASKLNTAPREGQTGHSGSKGFFLLGAFLLASLVCNDFYRITFGDRLLSTAAMVPANRGSIDNKINQHQPSTTVALLRQDVPQKELFKPVSLLPKNELTLYPSHLLPTSYQTAFVQTVEKNISAESKTPGTINEETQTPVTNTTALTNTTVSNPATINVVTTVVKEDTEEEKNKLKTHVPTLKAPAPKYARKLYAVAVMGPDFTTIKFNQVKSAGLGAGLLMGYRLTDKISVEAGLVWNRKKYYSEGRHFTYNYPLSSGTKLIDVNGYCEMWVLPVNVQYHFGKGTAHNWFVSTGVSSYLMQEEKYRYNYKRYNYSYSYDRKYEYKSQEWMAAANLSGGYEHQLGPAGSIRLESYLKLPFKGVGQGELPMTSAGVRLGFLYAIK